MHKNRAQGSLEYLIIVAAVLAVSAVVVVFVSGMFGSVKPDVSKCKSAATMCANKMITTQNPSCSECDVACVDSSGKDVMSGTPGGGLACYYCKHGKPTQISQNPDKSLVAFWTFDEGSGNTAKDISGNNNNGQITGATWTTGKFGNGLSFDGVDDYVGVANPTDFSQNATVSLWAKWSFTGTPTTLSMVTFGTGSWAFYLGTGSQNPGKIALAWHAGLASTWHFAIGPGGLNDGNWHHIAATKNGSTITTYIDGIAYPYTPGGWMTIASINAIGNGSYGYFNGTIDEFAVYNRALTPDEIQKIAS